jgi:hypothetical protein
MSRRRTETELDTSSCATLTRSRSLYRPESGVFGTSIDRGESVYTDASVYRVSSCRLKANYSMLKSAGRLYAVELATPAFKLARFGMIASVGSQLTNLYPCAFTKFSTDPISHRVKAANRNLATFP